MSVDVRTYGTVWDLRVCISCSSTGLSICLGRGAATVYHHKGLTSPVCTSGAVYSWQLQEHRAAGGWLCIIKLLFNYRLPVKAHQSLIMLFNGEWLFCERCWCVCVYTSNICPQCLLLFRKIDPNTWFVYLAVAALTWPRCGGRGCASAGWPPAWSRGPVSAWPHRWPAAAAHRAASGGSCSHWTGWFPPCSPVETRHSSFILSTRGCVFVCYSKNQSMLDFSVSTANTALFSLRSTRTVRSHQEVPFSALLWINHYHKPLILPTSPQNSDCATFKPIISLFTKWAKLHDETGSYKRLSVTERTTVVCEQRPQGHCTPFQATICYKQHNACCSSMDFNLAHMSVNHEDSVWVVCRSVKADDTGEISGSH